MKSRNLFCAITLSALVLAGGLFVLSAAAQSPAAAKSAAPAQGAATTAQPKAATRPAPAWQGTQLRGLSQRAEMYYQTVWGVAQLRVKSAESGELIRFDYQVVDPQKAATLNDKKFEPELIDSEAGVRLAIPQLEKVGKLRQSSTPKAGMTYWMAFANPTLVVRRGHKVDVVIGSFRANSLVVE
ncbi:MAG TPA: hypothetical protein VE263_05500 [Candidatus Angelobacter sp.]|nr:hypothetical protein [Candidatus Angelobacter sp.]